ncbi:MAG: helix-turn-helix domain-containing protein [Thermoguttaceae bacterium]
MWSVFLSLPIMHSFSTRQRRADAAIPDSAANNNGYSANGISAAAEPIPHLLTVDEVAQVLRCSRSTVYSLVSSAKIAGLRIGSHSGGIRISGDDLQTYLDTCRIEPTGRRRAGVGRLPKLKHLRI